MWKSPWYFHLNIKFYITVLVLKVIIFYVNNLIETSWSVTFLPEIWHIFYTFVVKYPMLIITGGISCWKIMDHHTCILYQYIQLLLTGTFRFLYWIVDSKSSVWHKAIQPKKWRENFPAIGGVCTKGQVMAYWFSTEGVCVYKSLQTTTQGLCRQMYYKTWGFSVDNSWTYWY